MRPIVLVRITPAQPVAAEGGRVEQFDFDPNAPTRFVARLANSVRGAIFALYVAGVAMEPRLRSGDMILV